MLVSIEQHANGPRRSRRIEKQRRAYANIVNMALMAEIMAEVKKPTSVEEALANTAWKDAMQEDEVTVLRCDNYSCTAITKI